MYQYEAVEQVMAANGGWATLKHLYEHAPHVEESEWGTKTPNASIRRILQERDRFFKIRPGLWALTADRETLPDHLYAPDADDPTRTTYDHSHFQGLLAEVGNQRAADTWIPNQDQHQHFLDQTLGTVRSLETLPSFGYDWAVDRAATVDVVWFNDREMPQTLFEVEFSTDFQNSLHKFLDLQDYHAAFVIAADETRVGQYEKRLGQTGFDAIRDRVEFLSFEDVSTLHAATDAAAGIADRVATA